MNNISPVKCWLKAKNKSHFGYFVATIHKRSSSLLKKKKKKVGVKNPVIKLKENHTKMEHAVQRGLIDICCTLK